MYCSKCGSQNRDKAKFCQKCGEPLVDRSVYSGRKESDPIETPERERAESGKKATEYTKGLAGALRRLIDSPLYLMTAACLTVQILFGVLSAGAGRSTLTNLIYQILEEGDLGYYLSGSEIDALVNAMSRTNVASAVLANIPAIAICVGLWMLLVQAINRNKRMDITGLTVIRVVTIIRFVLLLLGLAFAVITTFVALAALSGYSDNVWIIVVFALIILAVVAYMTVTFYLKVLKMIGSAKDIIISGTKTAPAYLYVIVITFIAAGLQIISALSSLFTVGFTAFLSSAAGAAASVGFGLLMNRFNTLEMLVNDTVENNPVHISGYKAEEKYRDDSFQEAFDSRDKVNEDQRDPVKHSNIVRLTDEENTNRLDDDVTMILEDDTDAAPLAKLTNVKDESEILITKTNFIIGKAKGKVDGLIDNNPAISRNHAIITQNDGRFYVIDTKSTNHVYVDGNQIPPEIPIPVKDGMRVKFADEEYLFTEC